MVTNMLKAISQMLNVDGATAAPSAFERVKCAKIMLDEIIKGMEAQSTTTISTTQATITKGHPQPQAISPLAPALEEKQLEYTMEIDPVTKVLKWMKRDGKPLGLKEMLLIDGKQVPYERAVGMPFKKISVVADGE